MFDNIRNLLIETPSVLVIFLRHRRDPRLQSSLWSKVLSVLASERSVGEHVLRIMLLAVEQNQLPGDLHPEDDELDVLVKELVTRLLNHCDTEILSTVRDLLQHPGNFAVFYESNMLSILCNKRVSYAVARSTRYSTILYIRSQKKYASCCTTPQLLRILWSFTFLLIF